MKNTVASLIVVLSLSFVTSPLAEAGRIPGPGKDTIVCQAYSSVTYYDTFRGGDIARIALVDYGAPTWTSLSTTCRADWWSRASDRPTSRW